MPARIQHIEAEGLGPLSSFSQRFQSLNLIYSPNEGGKSLLTEFLTSALFRKYQGSRLKANGKVYLSGLGDDTQAFSPGSRSKLEDHLSDTEGLPADLTRLLVVVGSEPRISGTNGAVDKEMLRTFLSEQQMLDQVLSPIQKTIQSASLEEGVVQINRQGRGKDLQELQERLRNIHEQLQAIDNNYASGRLQALKQQLTTTEEAIAIQQHAKRHNAHKLHQQLQDLNQTLSRYDPELLSELERDIQDYERARKAQAQAEQDYQQAVEKEQYHQWLQQVRDQYQLSQGQAVVPPSSNWLIGALLAFLLGLVAIFLGSQTAAVVLLLGMAAAIGLYLYRYQQAQQQTGDQGELANLKERFYEETGQQLGSLADIDAVMQPYSQAASDKQRLEQLTSDKKQEQDQLETRIQQAFTTLKGIEPEYGAWQNQVAAIRQERQESLNQREELQAQLDELGVAASDYEPNPASEAYSGQRLTALQEQLEDLRTQLQEEEESLTNFKSNIGALTGQNLVNAPFNEAYEALLQEREQVAQAYTDTKSDIVAGKMVSDLVDTLKQTDDRKIEEALASESLQQPVRAITNRYQDLSLDEEGQLLVQDRIADFPLSTLSTGAYEQVMLALRAGISARLLQQDGLFLWLDDALQNTDWQKRPAAIQYLADLAKAGWQITYLTMDDHIRDTFDRIGHETLPDAYQRIDLEEARQ
jgi:Skp family chaperone for outer membrane proteins